MGYGIYQYPHSRFQWFAGHQQQQDRYLPADQCDSADCRNFHGYDTCLPDLHTDFPSGVYGAWHESYPFWYHADLQPLYRNHHTACGHHTVCGRQGGKGEDRDGVQTAFDLFCSDLRCTYAGNLYPAAQSLAAKSDGICVK